MTPIKYRSEIAVEVVRQDERDPARTELCDACRGIGAEQIWSPMGRPRMYATCWTCDGWGWLLPAPVSMYSSTEIAA